MSYWNSDFNFDNKVIINAISPQEINGICVKGMEPNAIEDMLRNYEGKCEIVDFHIVTYPLECAAMSIISNIFVANWNNDLFKNSILMTGGYNIQYNPGNSRTADFIVIDRKTRPSVAAAQTHFTQLTRAPHLVGEIVWMEKLGHAMDKKNWYFSTLAAYDHSMVEEVWIVAIAQDSPMLFGIPDQPANLVYLPASDLDSDLNESLPSGLTAIIPAFTPPPYPQPYIAVYNRLPNPMEANFYALSWNSLFIPPEGSVVTGCCPVEINMLFRMMLMA